MYALLSYTHTCTRQSCGVLWRRREMTSLVKGCPSMELSQRAFKGTDHIQIKSSSSSRLLPTRRACYAESSGHDFWKETARRDKNVCWLKFHLVWWDWREDTPSLQLTFATLDSSQQNHQNGSLTCLIKSQMPAKEQVEVKQFSEEIPQIDIHIFKYVWHQVPKDSQGLKKWKSSLTLALLFLGVCSRVSRLRWRSPHNPTACWPLKIASSLRGTLQTVVINYSQWNNLRYLELNIWYQTYKYFEPTCLSFYKLSQRLNQETVKFSSYQ